MCVVGGGWTEDRRPVLLLKPDMPPLGTLQCVGQPQGVCEGGPWGAEENVRARPLGWPYQRVHQPPRPYLLPEMSVQMAMCQGGGCRLKVGGGGYGENHGVGCFTTTSPFETIETRG